MSDNSNNRSAFEKQWQFMRDFYSYEVNLGLDVDLNKRLQYLPATSGIMKDLQNTETAEEALHLYNKYYRGSLTSCKAFFRKAVNSAKNTIHRESASYEVPIEFDYILKSATDLNDTIEEFHQSVTFSQCLLSRAGYLVEIDVDNDIKKADFYFVSYSPEQIKGFGYNKTALNKKKKYAFIILDTTNANAKETEFTVLGIQDGKYFQKIYEQEPDANNYDPELEEDVAFITYRGRFIEEIPFVFMGATSLRSDFEQPIFSNSAYLDWNYWLLSADQKQHLHENAQGVWVFDGMSNDDMQFVRMGAGGKVNSQNPIKVYHAGVSADGLEAQRQALKDIEDSADAENIGSIKQVSGESGVARVTILEARTLPLVDIALTSSAGIEKLLHFIADWSGQSRDLFSVQPNINFFARDLDANLLRELVAAKAAGAAVSQEMIYDLLNKANIAKQTFEEVMREAEKEKIEEPEIEEEIKIEKEV